MSKKIIAFINPFTIQRDIYVFENGINLSKEQSSLEDFNKTIFNLVETEQINEIDLYGAKNFVKGLKKQLQKTEQIKYNRNDLIINIL